MSETNLQLERIRQVDARLEVVYRPDLIGAPLRITPSESAR